MNYNRGAAADQITIKILQCKRCGHKWIPRITTQPAQCPKCKSPLWNREYTRKQGGK